MTIKGLLFNLTMAVLMVQPLLVLQLVAVAWMWFIAASFLLLAVMLGQKHRAVKPIPGWAYLRKELVSFTALTLSAAYAGWIITASAYGAGAILLVCLRVKNRGYAHP